MGIFFTRQLQKSGFPFKKFAFSSDELKKRFFFEQKFLCLSAPVVLRYRLRIYDYALYRFKKEKAPVSGMVSRVPLVTVFYKSTENQKKLLSEHDRG